MEDPFPFDLMNEEETALLPSITPQIALTWPQHGFPDDPLHCQVVRGWHSFGSRGNWDIKAIIADYSTCLQFSECRSDEDPPHAVEKRWKTFTFSPTDGVTVILANPATDSYFLTVWAHCPEIAKRQFLSLRNHYLRKPKRQPGESNFCIITTARGALDTRVITLKPLLRHDKDVLLHYGPEFADWNLEFIAKLKARKCGVSIFRGEPGTGKTSYLRYLTHKLQLTHRFYYLPLTVYPMLSNPSAVDFWMGEDEMYRKFRKVVLVEDSEALLM